MWYYPEPLPKKSKRHYVDIPGEWDSPCSFKKAEWVRMAIARGYDLMVIIHFIKAMPVDPVEDPILNEQKLDPDLERALELLLLL